MWLITVVGFIGLRIQRYRIRLRAANIVGSITDTHTPYAAQK